jgi:hypothetical protein
VDRYISTEGGNNIRKELERFKVGKSCSKRGIGAVTEEVDNGRTAGQQCTVEECPQSRLDQVGVYPNK